MRKQAAIYILLLLLGCQQKPATPKELYDQYRSAVVLIKTDYIHVAHLDNGRTIYFRNDLSRPSFVVYTDRGSAIQEPLSVTGTGFFVSQDGKIATNRHVIYPSGNSEGMADYFKNAYLESEREIDRQIFEKTNERAKLMYDNPFADSLTFEKRQDIRDRIEKVENEIFELKLLKKEQAYNPSKTRIETEVLHQGIVYDNTYVNRQSDFQETVVVEKSEDDFVDLAIIQLKTKRTPDNVTKIFDIQNSNLTPNLDDKVYMIGYNQGFNLAQTSEGIKAQFTSGAITQEPDKSRVLYSIPTLQGSSGSPIIDEHGELVAINFAKTMDFQGFSFGVPAQRLIELNQGKLQKSNTVQREENTPERREKEAEVETPAEDLPDLPSSDAHKYAISTGSNINIRSGAGTTFSIIDAIMEEGIKVLVLEKKEANTSDHILARDSYMQSGENKIALNKGRAFVLITEEENEVYGYYLDGSKKIYGKIPRKDITRTGEYDWLKIKTASGTTGWAYGQFFDEVE